MKKPFSMFGVHALAAAKRLAKLGLACSAILGLLFSIFAFMPAAAAANTVPQWGVYEIELNGPTNGNPFLDVRFSAVFSNGSRSIEAAGFYDGDGVYRIRFMPDQPGAWHYETRSNRARGGQPRSGARP
jgi:hypothetical protein